MKQTSKLKLAIVGCGAVAQAHLPVALASPYFEVTALVDKVLPRARQLADEFHIPVAVADYRDLIGTVEAAIITLPHHLHAPVSVDLLQAGMHLLVEKPMAMTAAECDEMLAAAGGGATLAVGLVRRFYDATRLVKDWVQAGLLGEVQGFDVREGAVYNWPAVSDFPFRKETGGGVLADIGSHALDTLLWWLGDWDSFDYFDDALGGVEADCELRLALKSGAVGIVELSRTRDLRNTIILRGTRGTLEVGTTFNAGIRLKLEGGVLALEGRARGGAGEEDVWEVFRRQLDDFAGAILQGRPPRVTGEEARRAVALIEACHHHRQPLRYPWED